jgi:hypothetical protein
VQGGEMNQALYAHMNNKTIRKYISWRKKIKKIKKEIEDIRKNQIEILELKSKIIQKVNAWIQQ